MKILHINSYYGKSHFYKNLFELQIKEKLDIQVYVPVSNKFNTEIFDYGQYTKISPCYAEWERLIFPFKHNKIYSDIKRKINVTNFDCYHAHSWFSNGYIAYKLNQNFNIPYIVAIRNTDINVFYKYMIYLRELGHKILLNASKIIFISPAYRNKLIDELLPAKIAEAINSKSVIIPNGIDNYWHENKYIGEKRDKLAELKILYVGNIDKNKNLLTTCKAIDLLINEGINVTYTVVGKIQSQKVFNMLSSKKYFKYLGIKEKTELRQIYRSSDIFVMPSKTETFGLVYAEALSQGVPIIYSRGQGFDGWFKEGTVGYSVSCEDHKEIYEKIKLLMNNPVNITQDVIKRFAWEDIANQYNKIYYEIVRGVNCKE